MVTVITETKRLSRQAEAIHVEFYQALNDKINFALLVYSPFPLHDYVRRPSPPPHPLPLSSSPRRLRRSLRPPP